MKPKLVIPKLLGILIVTSCFQSIKNKSIIKSPKIAFNYTSDSKDSLSLLDLSKIDYGFSKDINFWNAETHELYKKSVKRLPASAEYLNIKSENAYIEIVFSPNSEVEIIGYSSLKFKKRLKNCLKVKYTYHTDKYGFKIGDTMSSCLKKLNGVKYNINKESPKEIEIEIHGIVVLHPEKTNPEYDEYRCIYHFFNNRLDRIFMTYFRDINYPKIDTQ